MLLFLALFFALLAAVVFAYDFIKSGWNTLTSAGLMFVALGFACFILDLLHKAGKL